MNGDTTQLIKTEPGSMLLGVSIRAWLAIILTGTVCGIVTTNIILACLGYTSTTVTIPEPLYSGFMIALGAYFSQSRPPTKPTA